VALGAAADILTNLRAGAKLHRSFRLAMDRVLQSRSSIASFNDWSR
jgi:hypothetical protein